LARVLIVDDEKSIRTTLAEFVREDGHDVETANDAEQAMQHMRTSPFDVVVTDIILPRVTGMMLLDRVRRFDATIQVIMITGEPTVETAAEAVRQGAFDYLSKPILREDIRSIVQSAARVKAVYDERRRLEEENEQYREHLEEQVAQKTQALAISEEKYRRVIENANEAVFVVQQGRIRFFNPMTETVSGYSRRQLDGITLEELVHSEDRETVVRDYRERMEGRQDPEQYEFRMVTASGDVKWIAVRPVFVEWEGQPAMLSFAVDTTKRHAAEKALVDSERKWRELFERMRDGWMSTDMNGRFRECNRAFEQLLGYTLAELQSLTQADVTPAEWCDADQRIVERVLLKGYSGLYEKEYIRKDGSVFHVELSEYLVRDETGQPAGMWGLARDITDRVAAQQGLESALEGTIAALGQTTETRDPYTAGHQRRVSALAAAIGGELDLDELEIDGIRAAGLMHDIGKMAVPAEILSKPSELTPMEMELIRSHPEAAYRILRVVTFPWPVAEIVLQHHERLNGSGYPNGLIGDAIRLDARILAVADVVEAMASHRPYRPALGIDAALKEIRQERGVLYDRTVVDACLRVFRDRGLAFPETAQE